MPFRKSPVTHFVKISSSVFKTHLLVSTWKANSWRWELNFEISGHQKYSHHIGKDWQTTITVHKNIGLKKLWQATRCSPLKACANGLEVWVESSLLPFEESCPQGILEVAGRPSSAIYHFQTWLLNVKVITWQGLLSSEFCSWHPASCPRDLTQQSRWV